MYIYFVYKIIYNHSKHTNKTTGYVTNYTTWRISISGSLARLLVAMGATPYNKTEQPSIIPDFVLQSSLVIKKAFLSAIFGGVLIAIGVYIVNRFGRI